MALSPGAFIRVAGTPATPQFARIVIRGITTESNATSKPCFNIIDFRCVGPGAGGSLLTLMNSFQASIETQLLACVTADYTLDSYLAKYLDNPLSLPEVKSVANPGTVSTDRGPSFNSVVVRKKSGIASRSYRGSMHFGAVPETFTTKDELNSTGLTPYNSLTAAFSNLISSGIGDGVNTFFPIIISSVQSNLLSNPAIISGAAVTSYFLNTKIGTMKRRKEKTPIAL